jgi:hypothetical protein
MDLALALSLPKGSAASGQEETLQAIHKTSQ